MNQNYHPAQYNSLLLRFLVAATVVFALIALLLYLKQGGEDKSVSKEQVNIDLRFSALAGLQETILGYRDGAEVLFDIESYPEVQALFFSSPIDFSIEKTKMRLEEVKNEQVKSDDFAKSHVYHTSYYIGNLLVRADETLDGLLQSKARPQTTLLLETFLADVRAGTLALQIYFDQATPAQHNPALGGALYFTQPSFPSLTVAEAAAVLYLLADLDPKNAAFYEHSLHQYLNQTFATGAHFRIDMEYALQLVAIYFARIQEEPTYLALKEMAALEWNSSEPIEVTLRVVTPQFVVVGFPVSTNPQAIVTGEGYMLVDTDEILEGQLRLSLIDLRLPNLVSTLYEYEFGNAQILPITSQFIPRNYSNLEASSYFARYEGAAEYLFLTGPQPTVQGLTPLPLSPARIVSRTQNTIDLVVGDKTDTTFRLWPERSRDKTFLLYTEADRRSELSKEQATGTAKVVNAENELVKEIFNTRAATFIGSGTRVAYLRGDSILVSPVRGTDPESTVATVERPVRAFGFTDGLKYLPDANILLYFKSYSDENSAESRSEIILFAINEAAGIIKLGEISRLTMTDVAVSSVALSPGLRYLAVTQAGDFSQAKRGVLIFDTISGIIKKDIPLTSFAAPSLHLDAWTLF